MKRLLFMFFLFLCADFAAVGQTSTVVSQLTPVPTGTKKVSKMLPELKNPLVDYYNKLNFELKIESVMLVDGKKAAAFTMQTTYEEMVFEPRGEKIVSRMELYARITSKDKKTDGFFEDKLTVAVDDAKTLEDSLKIKTPVIVRRVFELPEGKYKIGMVVRDFTTGMRGVKFVKFQISSSGTVMLSSE